MTKQPPIRVLITAGPTRAYLDEVRFLSNYSSGEMAFEVVRELIRRKVDVAVVSGPTQQPWHTLKTFKLSQVETVGQMRKAVLDDCRKFRPHFVIFAAAVLDFEPPKARSGKVSSKKKSWTLRLVPTKKIIDEVGSKFPAIQRVGFKLEWKKPRRNSLEKFGQTYLARKQLQALVLNFLPEIKPPSHPAYLFTSKGLVSHVRTKRAAATWIAEWVKKKNAARRII